jgi:hypothetical protein
MERNLCRYARESGFLDDGTKGCRFQLSSAVFTHHNRKPPKPPRQQMLGSNAADDGVVGKDAWQLVAHGRIEPDIHQW